MSLTIPEPKSPPPKAEWPIGTYKANCTTFQQFAEENFVTGAPAYFTKKEVKGPILIYTPEKEKDAVVKIWRVMMRFMGDMVDYRKDYEQFSGHKSYQPDFGSVMTRLCRVLGTPQMDNPFGPQYSQVEPVLDIPMQTLPQKPRRGTWKRLKDTITKRIFGRDTKTVFHLLPLEETLRTQLERLQFIVGYGLLRPRLRDEIYCGLCRQLTHNVYKESIKNGWLLMNIVAGCFPPSQRCLDAVMQFLDTAPKIHSASAKAFLQRTLQNGDRLHPPSALELEAISEYKPLELRLHMTGIDEFVTVPVDGASTSGEVCDAAVRQLQLKNGFGFHVFVTTRDKVSSLGCGQDHIMDALSQLEQMSRDYGLSGDDATWRLYLRKEIFEPWEDLSLDSKATTIIYEQLKGGVLQHDYEFLQDEELHLFLAKAYYIDHGVDFNEDTLKDNFVAEWMQNKSGIEDLTDNRRTEEIKERLDLIKTQFDTLYGDNHVKSNTFTVKLDIIAQARIYWLKHFARIYEAGAFQNGDVIDGVNYLSVHSQGIFLLGENHLVLQELSFMEILQLSQENDPDHEGPPSLVFTTLGDRVIECVTQDVDDVIDLVSHFLMGLSERSSYAVAVADHTASTVNDLDLKVGDLIILDQAANKTTQMFEDNVQTIYTGSNQRTGQMGEIQGYRIHILPTIETPDNKILESYCEHYG